MVSMRPALVMMYASGTQKTLPGAASNSVDRTGRAMLTTEDSMVARKTPRPTIASA